MTSSRFSQSLILLLVALMAAVTGGVFVRALDRSRGIRVAMGPDGSEIHVWNSTHMTWSRCSVLLDNRYGLEASTIPERTLVMLPIRLFGAPDEWKPDLAVVRCEQPRRGSWQNRVGPPRF